MPMFAWLLPLLMAAGGAAIGGAKGGGKGALKGAGIGGLLGTGVGGLSGLLGAGAAGGAAAGGAGAAGAEAAGAEAASAGAAPAAIPTAAPAASSPGFWGQASSRVGQGVDKFQGFMNNPKTQFAMNALRGDGGAQPVTSEVYNRSYSPVAPPTVQPFQRQPDISALLAALFGGAQ